MKLGSTILGAVAALALSLSVGCDDKKDGDKKTEEKKTETKDGKTVTTTKIEEKKTEVKEAPPADAKVDDAGGGGGDKIGVAECDEYIEKYSKCIGEKMPEASRAATKEAMDATVKAWKDAAAAGGKDALVTGCKAALDTAKQATSSMGCTW